MVNEEHEKAAGRKPSG